METEIFLQEMDKYCGWKRNLYNIAAFKTMMFW